jgi:tetratricopeptide (TPR) repeat protein
MKKAILAAILAMCALSARPAGAATAAEQAETLIRQGVQLRAQDQTARALPIFEEAYRVSPTARPAAQLGLCELELGRFAEAERHLSEALAPPGRGPENAWIAKNRPVLERQLETARANIGELAITVSPAGADVSLNGKLLEQGQLGGAIRLSKGPVDVVVRAPGYVMAHETINIVGGKREVRNFTLPSAGPKPVVAAAVPTPSGPPVAVPAAAVVAPPPAVGVEVPEPASSHTDGKRVAAWITAGAAVGALAFGTIEAFNAASKRDAFNDHTLIYGGVPVQDCGTSMLTPACRQLKDAYDQAITLTVVGFATAGALAAASSVLFVLSSSGHAGTPEETGAARALTCAPDVRNRGFGCALRF